MVDSSLHPDTGLPVPLPFRLSAFVPTNLIIVGGMLMPNPTLKGVLFWQWANQSLNGASVCSVCSRAGHGESADCTNAVCVNYSNANKSIVMTNQEIATGAPHPLPLRQAHLTTPLRSLRDRHSGLVHHRRRTHLPRPPPPLPQPLRTVSPRPFRPFRCCRQRGMRQHWIDAVEGDPRWCVRFRLAESGADARAQGSTSTHLKILSPVV